MDRALRSLRSLAALASHWCSIDFRGSWKSLGVSWERLGGLLKALGVSWELLAASWDLLDAYWSLLGRLAGFLKASCVLEASWSFFGMVLEAI